MALIKIEPYIIDATGDFTFNNVNATGNLSSLNANLGNLAQANFFSGSGANLTNLPAGNISGQVGNALVAGTVYTAAQPNITSVGTLTGLTSNGIVNFANTSNTTLGAVGNVRITGGSSGQYLQTDGSGTLTWASVSSGSTSNISNGNSNVNIPSSNGNINLTAVGNTTMVITGTGANIAGTLNITGNATVGNLVTSGSGGTLSNINVVSANTFTASGNITAGNANLGNAVTANFFIGNGSLLTGISTTSISNGNSNVSIPTANGNINISSAGNANIVVVTGTGVNVAGTLNATGNTTVGNLFSSGSGGNISNVNVISANTFVASGNVTAGNIVTSGSGGNISNANVISANTFIASGNITAANLVGILANGNSNVSIPTANGNINISAGGTPNELVITSTGVNVAGTLNATGNANVGNLGATGVIATTLGGSLTTAAQPNITSVGTLTGLTSTGTINLTGASNVSLGAVGNVKITGGSNGQYLQTDGSGTLTWSSVASGSTSNISNGNSNVNIPAGNGNINISSAGNANIVVVTGTGVNVAGTLNISGNTTVSNLISSGTGGNISNANVISANTFIASGNITATNINTTGSGGNIGNANVISANTLTASGNINGADLSLSGNGVFGGNLTVNGTLTYINSTTLSISDPIINLQTGANGAAPTANSGKDVGTALNYYDTSAKIAWMGWDVSNAEIAFGSNVGISSEVVTFTSLANIRSGNASLGNNVTANFFTGTLTTAAQPNVTSVGSLTGLTVSNATGAVDFTTTANVTLGAVANLHITGGTNAYVLSTDGAGNLSWVAQSGGGGASISNGNSNVNIATANGNITFSAVGNANIVTVTGTGVNVAGTLNVTGQSNLGAVGNVIITGGTANYMLTTDGAGNLSWTAPPGGANVTVDNFTGNGVQTVFTLSTTPTGINQTSVNYNGATVLRSDYTLSNANITFSSAPADGSLIEVTTINLTTSGGGGTSSAAAVGYSLIFGG